MKNDDNKILIIVVVTKLTTWLYKGESKDKDEYKCKGKDKGHQYSVIKNNIFSCNTDVNIKGQSEDRSLRTWRPTKLGPIIFPFLLRNRENILHLIEGEHSVLKPMTNEAIMRAEIWNTWCRYERIQHFNALYYC